MPPEVVVLGTGGTIASTAGESGATPELSTDNLLSAVPEIEEYADVTAEEVAQVPSFDMDLGTIAQVRERVRNAAADGADGVVVTHGTDTLEESAYYLDLTLAGSTAPVYGTPGGGETLRERGAIFGGDLPAHKARIKLLLVVAEITGPAEVREYFEAR